jgi:outer membrane protein assembly factor BamB
MSPPALWLLLPPLLALGSDPIFDVELGTSSRSGAAMADLDGDAVPEILFGTSVGAPQVLALRRDGSVALTLESHEGGVTAPVTPVDLDEDGEAEITWGGAQGVQLHLTDASGENLWSAELGETLHGARAIGDLDGDDRLDIIAASCDALKGSGSLRAFTGLTGELLWEAETPGCYTSAPLLFDQDGDALPDVVAAVGPEALLRAFSGLDGSLRWETALGGAPSQPGSFGDLDGNGIPDIAIADSTATLHVVDGGAGALMWSLAIEGEIRILGPTAMGDVDGDGRLEIVLAGRSLHVYDEYGNVQWEKALPAECAGGPILVDHDGDGLPDVIAATSDLSVSVFAGVSSRLLASVQLDDHGHSDGDMLFQPAVWDLDGDGSMELFLVHGGPDPAAGATGWGRAVLLSFGGHGFGWPTVHHDHHNSSNFEYPPGAYINDPDWPPEDPGDTGPLDTGWGRGKDDGSVDLGRCGCTTEGTTTTALSFAGLLALLVLRARGRAPSRRREHDGARP